MDEAMERDPVAAAIARYTKLEEWQRWQDEAGSVSTQELFDAPIIASRRLLDELCAVPEVADAMRASLDAAEDDEAVRTSPLFRLASYYAGHLTTGRSAELEPSAAGEQLLSGSLLTLPPLLEFMQLRIGDRQVGIQQVRPQDAAYNAKYLNTRPVFGPDRRYAYVGAVQAGYMLFLAAGSPQEADSCVALMAVQLPDGSKVDKPTKTAHALGLDCEMVGDVRLEEGVLVLDLEPRLRPARTRHRDT